MTVLLLEPFRPGSLTLNRARQALRRGDKYVTLRPRTFSSRCTAALRALDLQGRS